jgi:transcriptional regulator GlxA family with amidase domain
MLEESAGLYGPLLDCHRDLAADRRAQADFGALQTIVNDLELLLIGLVRQCRAQSPAPPPPRAITGDEERAEAVMRLKEYLRAHLREPVSFRDCCAYLGMSATTLKRLFSAYHERGVMHCYQLMRVDEARRLLRSGRWNVSGVASVMGYSSCQMFSAQFRRLTGMCPTTYLKRVAARPETLTTRAGNENRAGNAML